MTFSVNEIEPRQAAFNDNHKIPSLKAQFYLSIYLIFMLKVYTTQTQITLKLFRGDRV